MVRNLRRWMRPQHLLPLAGVVAGWLLLDFALDRMAVDSRRPHAQQAVHPAVGETFNDLASLRARQQAIGYELLGLLDVHFPVRVLTVRHSPGEIALTSADGARRLYRADDGQRLQAMAVAGVDTARGWIIWRQVARSAAEGTRVSLR